MTVKTYTNLLDEMKELADKINKHYDTVTLETVEELDTPETETQRILNELKDKGVLTEEEMQEAWWDKKEPGKIDYEEIGSEAGRQLGKKGNESDIDELHDIQEQLFAMVDDAFAAVRQSGNSGAEQRSDAYWYPHIKSALGSDEYGRSMYSLGDAIEEIASGHPAESIGEGWQNVSPIDKERYTEIPDLEGPFMTMSGKVVYYDPKEGKYYDRDSDMYLDYDEWKKYDSKPDWGKDEDVSEATMQRQHFEVIADIIGSFPSTMKIRKDFMTHAMDKLREINPQFKDSTFVARVRKAMADNTKPEPSDELGKRSDHDETPSEEEYR